MNFSDIKTLAEGVYYIAQTASLLSELLPERDIRREYPEHFNDDFKPEPVMSKANELDKYWQKQGYGIRITGDELADDTMTRLIARAEASEGQEAMFYLTIAQRVYRIAKRLSRKSK